MSTYTQSPFRPQSDDIYANVQQRLASRNAPSPMSVGVEQYKHLRRAAPADIPLRRTLMWVASLPSTVQPTFLVCRFARIANLIAAMWADPKSFNTYTESLLTDTRGNRRGFPPEVLAELVALRHYRAAVTDDECAWDTVGKRG
jgi:hypothetical protein